MNLKQGSSHYMCLHAYVCVFRCYLTLNQIRRLVWKQMIWVWLLWGFDGRRSLCPPGRAGNVPDSRAPACNNPHPQMNVQNTRPAGVPRGRAAGESGATSSDPGPIHSLQEISAVWNHSGERGREREREGGQAAVSQRCFQVSPRRLTETEEHEAGAPERDRLI